MAKEFVLGSVGVHDAAGIYQQAWDFYAYLLKAERESDGLLGEINAQLEKAHKEQPDLVPEVDALRLKALEMSYRIREIRVQTMGVFVVTIGSILELVQGARDLVTGVEMALVLAQFDLDLDRAQQRYNEIYAPFYRLDKGEKMSMPDVRNWGALDWAIFEVKIAGPVLLWKTISECKTRWMVPGVPPCHGPDYLLAWILANQSGVMLESHAHALDAIAHSVHEFFKGATKTIVKLIVDTAVGLAKIAGQVVTGVAAGVAKGLGGFFPILLGVGAVFLAMNKEKIVRKIPKRKK